MPSDVSPGIKGILSIFNYFYNVGLIFIALAITPFAGFDIILLTRFVIHNRNEQES